jgi:glycolate oxidase
MISPEIIRSLAKILPPRGLLVDKAELKAYAYDATATWVKDPEIVVLPESTDQIARIMKLADQYKVPVTPRGGGTNLSGGSVPAKGGIVLCTTRMNRILEINKATLTATVEPGLTLLEFNTALAREGLFFPPDPQSAQGCTLGGMVAENSGGPHGAKYGLTRHYVLGLEVVLASGYVMNIGGVVPKNRAGYEITGVFIGSEGTLGIVTRITLRLLLMPQASQSLLAIFDDMVVAGEVVSRILANGILPGKIEFVDNSVVRYIEKVMPLGLPLDSGALLLIEVDGSPETVMLETRKIAEFCQTRGNRETRLIKDPRESERLWKARSAAVAAIFGAAPTVLIEDAVVPRDKIADFIRQCRQIALKYDLIIPLVGHAADGNIHPSILTDKNDPRHFERAKKAVDDIFKISLELGGTISGEHGIGLEKKHFLANAVDPMAIEIMKKMKQFLDPNNILNPGKIWQDGPL